MKNESLWNLLTFDFPPSLFLKITTRPPLSPVAKNSPEWSKCTADKMSAAGRAEFGTIADIEHRDTMQD